MLEGKTLPKSALADTRRDTFVPRHIGPSLADQKEMLATLGCDSLEDLISETVPESIRLDRPLDIASAKSEQEVLARLREIAGQNRVLRSYIGCGYYNTHTPTVIQRNVLENPGWYTQYTPYQAEISQGRLEALLNFQTMVCDLTGLPLANSSMLDEATSAAEAMTMCHNASKSKSVKFFVADDCHPQTIAVVETRAIPIGVEIVKGDPKTISFGDDYFGALIQYPNTFGIADDCTDFASRAHEAGTQVVVATDLLALLCLKSPAEMGADIAVGSAQRFGVPLGFGGPHAAFLACDDRYKRVIPGRLVGLSQDAHGRPALRLALQTREQHIRRAKATSNICTAQVLLAIMASMYAVYHGPVGLRRIAERVHRHACTLADGLRDLGIEIAEGIFFDTLAVSCSKSSVDEVVRLAELHGYNLRRIDDDRVGISIDETTELEDIDQLLRVFAGDRALPRSASEISEVADASFAGLARTSEYLTHPVFHTYHSEHELLRYLNRLQARDLSLTTSMIPLGSCTMKLNATTEMIPVTWPEFGGIHPFAPASQTVGYQVLFRELEEWLAEITGFAATSLQPNAGSQGEYSGLLTIRAFHEASGDHHRKICLIPDSAHGTNPASAVMAGYKVVAVKCDKLGNIDVDHLREKAEAHREELAALMITYPSTHGVFEETIKDICAIVHEFGGQVYMDGANMNAQVGLCRPGDMGADVCHLNLHKTFCIPHGGGGPGVGPICVARHLEPFLPGHPLSEEGSDQAIGPVAAAAYGSASILPISWAYIAMMGCDGLLEASQVAILNANYMAHRLDGPYKILYTGTKNRVAHEFILDVRPFKTSAEVGVDDIAKRMIDYRFHAPTMSWPVPGTLMIEPTESESREELDRFCDATLAIRQEIEEVESGEADRTDNVLRNAPHTAHEVTGDVWTHPYGREKAAFPIEYLRDHKFWPAVSRVDNAYGDRNLVCSCPPMSEYTDG